MPRPTKKRRLLAGLGAYSLLGHSATLTRRFVAVGEPWSDGTFFTDNTGWINGAAVTGQPWSDGTFFTDGKGWI